jgi:hypothetical protein
MTNTPVARTADEHINTQVMLDFEQRARAVSLESAVSDDEYATAAEIIWLRDEANRLRDGIEEICKLPRTRPSTRAQLRHLVAGVDWRKAR